MLSRTRSIAVVAVAVVWLGGSAPAPTPDERSAHAAGEALASGRVEPGAPFERTFDLAAGRYLELAVRQLEGDIDLTLRGPSGVVVAASGMPGRPSQEEVVAVVADVSGAYTVRIESSGSATGPARFELRTTARRRATRRDARRAEGLQRFQQGMRLRQLQTAASTREAVEALRQAAAIFSVASEAAWQGRALEQMASTLQQLGELDEARDGFGLAVTVLREAGDGAALAEALSSYGSLLADLGEFEAGMSLCRQAMTLSRELGAMDLEATSLNNLAAIQYQRGRPEAAAESFEEIVALQRQLGNRKALATNLNNLGVVYRSLGRTQDALEAYNEALELELEFGLGGEELNNLYNNLGVLYRARGEVRRAIDAYGRARELAERRGDPATAAFAAYNEGSLYRKLGEPSRARALLGEALELSRKLESPTEARVLQALGALEADEGDYESALELLERARLRSEALGDRTGESYALYGMGRCRLQLNELVAARAAFQSAQSIQRELGDRPGLSSTLRFLSIVSARQGELERARSLNEEAFALAEEIGDPGQRASAREQRSALLESSGDLALAREELEESIRTLESLRDDLIRPDLRATFFARSQDRYVRLVSLIARLQARDGADSGTTAAATAFEVSERARARSLAERIWESSERLGQGADPELEGARRELRAKLSTSQLRLTELLQSEEADSAMIEIRRAEVGEIYRALQDLDRDLRRSDPRWASLTYPAPVGATEAQSLLRPEVALLSYMLGPDESFLFVLTDREVTLLPLPGEAALQSLVQELRKLLETPSRRTLGRFARVSRELYSLLIEPAESLIGDRKRLILVPDGSLHYLPFEALLSDGSSASSLAALQESYLISRWSVSYAPSVSVLSSLRSRAPEVAGHRVGWVAFADPTIPGAIAPSPSGPVLRGLGDQSSWRWRRLAGARAEVRGIERLFTAEESLVFLDDEAGERQFKAESAVSQARYLHFASHALVDNQRPDLSAVLLAPSRDGSEDGLLQAHEILDLHLTAELVVLSGCETALGRQVRGEGLVGLTQAFLFAGSRAVAVSLWPVEDESTGQLMRHFYGGLRSGEDTVEAMRQAKLEQLSSPATSHPYYWAPFVLVGELG